jgi:hypothetical protein
MTVLAYENKVGEGIAATELNRDFVMHRERIGKGIVAHAAAGFAQPLDTGT